jgi:carbamoyl-phosphate synthase large subunit
MMEPFNVLISSAGRRVALLEIFRRTLRGMHLDGEVLAVDMSRLSSAFHAADRAYQVPACRDPDFIPVMLDLCRREQVRLLVPTIDPELPVYAEQRQRFAEIGTTVSISTPEVIQIAGSKDATFAWLDQVGLPTVRQARVEEVLERPKAWPYPLLVKPLRGSASIGVAIVESRKQLEVATRDGGFIVQTIAPGIEHTVSLLADRSGRCLCAVPRRRLEVRSGEVSKGMTVRSRPVIDLAWRLCEALPGAYGALNVQMFYEENTGALNVIEINPRFGGGFPLAWQAGAHYPRWIIEEILGRVSAASHEGWQDRLVMLRYDDAIFVDAEKVGLPGS